MKNKNVSYCYKCGKTIEIGDLVSSDFFSHINCTHTVHTDDTKNAAVEYLRALATAGGK